MTFSDKLIALRKKAGWSQEGLAERLNVSRQSVSKWESAQSMPDIDKILQLSSLFSVTTDCLLKDTQDDTQPAAAQTPSPLPRVTLTQAEDYLTKAQANAPQMALATALCIVSPIPLLALGTVSELGLLGLDDNLAGGLGMIALVVLVAVAVVLFMQCGAAVREYEFLEKEPIETEHGVTALVRERRAAFAPEYDRANRMGAALCILAAVPLFAAVMVGVSFLMSMSICLLLVLVACGVYAFVRVGTVQDAMDRLLEDGWQKWKDLDEDTSYEVFCLCREFVAKTARGNRRTRIMNKGKNYVEPCGILRRLAYNFKRGEIEYTAGQDYNEEMKTLRGIFD